MSAEPRESQRKRRSPRERTGKPPDPRGFSPQARDIIEGANKLVETIRGGAPLEQRFTIHTAAIDAEVKPYTPEDVKRARDALRVSQTVFAAFLGVEVKTVRSWEQGLRTPSAMACRFLEEIEADPRHWQRRLAVKMRLHSGGSGR